jgi:hypothetical protein
MERIDIPRAPGLGLMLEEIHYERSELISDNVKKFIRVKNCVQRQQRLFKGTVA